MQKIDVSDTEASLGVFRLNKKRFLMLSIHVWQIKSLNSPCSLGIMTLQTFDDNWLATPI